MEMLKKNKLSMNFKAKLLSFIYYFLLAVLLVGTLYGVVFIICSFSDHAQAHEEARLKTAQNLVRTLKEASILIDYNKIKVNIQNGLVMAGLKFGFGLVCLLLKKSLVVLTPFAFKIPAVGHLAGTFLTHVHTNSLADPINVGQFEEFKNIVSHLITTSAANNFQFEQSAIAEAQRLRARLEALYGSQASAATLMQDLTRHNTELDELLRQIKQDLAEVKTDLHPVPSEPVPSEPVLRIEGPRP